VIFDGIAGYRGLAELALIDDEEIHRGRLIVGALYYLSIVRVMWAQALSAV
jgi:hypothetical protein